MNAIPENHRQYFCDTVWNTAVTGPIATLSGMVEAKLRWSD